MKTKLFISLLFITSFIFGQRSEDFLSIAVVRSDAVLIPVARYTNNVLIDLYDRINSLSPNSTSHNVYKILSEELWNREWKYYPFIGNESKLIAGDLIIYDPFGEYSGIGFLTNACINRDYMNYYPNGLAGIALSKKINYSFFCRGTG